MANLEIPITITAELRPCLVDGKYAFFHKWVEKSHIVPPSPMIGGHDGGVIKYALAIVEYENGKIAEVEPTSIQFVDEVITGLAADYEALLKRFLHLTKSRVIQEYDTHDPKTHTYKNDISKFDEEYEKYKSAYEILLRCTNCNGCKKAGCCQYVEWGERVVYNCPHYE